ncbi:MAG: ABC transporter permease [Candidatus Aminicenantes bacterium]|nr:MAG: ABC transporter permease [Candidatus Aminicenantes bacterium]
MAVKRRYKSPGLARKLLKLMSVHYEKHSIIEDFEETFSEIMNSDGRIRAMCWYWGNALKSVLGYLKLIVYWRGMMLKNHLKIAYRNFIRHKLYSFINVFGLAIGLSICMIISLWVLRELSYDRFHEKAHRIYRIERELFRDNLYSRWPITGGRYKQALIDDYPEIENASRFWRREFAIRDHDNFVHRQEMFAVDNSIFEMFDFHLEDGDEQSALADPMTVVLTRENAIKYLGIGDAVGKSLSFEWDGELVDFMVTGILEQVPENSHIHFDMLVSIVSYKEEPYTDWRSNYLYTYVQIQENTSKQDLEKKLKTFVSQRLEPEYGDLLLQDRSIHEVLKMHLFPIIDIHLHPSPNWEVEAGGSISSVYIFSCIAVLILIIACMNFVNLSTARASKRAKEVSLRKTVGAEKQQLRVQFIQESVLLAFASFVLALVMSSLFIQAYNGIFAESLSLSAFLQLKHMFFLVGATFIVGVLAGLYPAFYLTRFEPVEVLKGIQLSGSGKSVFRRNMVIIQFSISIILIVGMFTVYKQMKYIQTRSLGFDKENVVIFPVRSQKIAQNYGSFRNKLIQNAHIISASASSEVPADFHYSNTYFSRLDSDEPVSLYLFFCDYDYTETYRMEILAGRSFSRDFTTDTEGTIILNESAAHRFGWTPEEAVGKRLEGPYSEDAAQVVGVVKNFNYKSLRREVEPMALLLSPDYIRAISVRIKPSDVWKTLSFIQKSWETTFPSERFEYRFLDSRVSQLYESEKKMQDLFVIFSVLSILIACLGLLGLVSFTAELKTKEIGIRKVLGASTGHVVVLLSKEFIKWIILANLVAWPLAWFMMNKWLQNFAYRTEIGWIVFLLAAFVTMAIAIFTFIFQTIKTACAKPVNSLRYE